MTKGNKGYTREGISIQEWNFKLGLIMVFQKKTTQTYHYMLHKDLKLGTQIGHAPTMLHYMRTCNMPMACTTKMLPRFGIVMNLVHNQVIMVVPLCLPRLD
jgi:hypothetical protein